MTTTSPPATPEPMTMRERAATMQTTRTGIVSRLTADAIDLVVITILYFVVLVAWATVVYLATSKPFALPNPAPRFDAIALFVLQVIYLTIGWSGPRRTLGKALLGVRVVRSDSTQVSAARGFVARVRLFAHRPAVAALGCGQQTQRGAVRPAAEDRRHLRLAQRRAVKFEVGDASVRSRSGPARARTADARARARGWQPPAPPGAVRRTSG